MTNYFNSKNKYEYFPLMGSVGQEVGETAIALPPSYSNVLEELLTDGYEFYRLIFRLTFTL
jgi:hypothetical protein